MKKSDDKALEAYQTAYAKYSRERTQLLDWIQTNAQIKAEAKQNCAPRETDCAAQRAEVLQFFQPNAKQKKGELIFWTRGLLLRAILLFTSFKFHFMHCVN